MLFFLCSVLLLQQHLNTSEPSVLKVKCWTTVVDNYVALKVSIQYVSTGLNICVKSYSFKTNIF